MSTDIGFRVFWILFILAAVLFAVRFPTEVVLGVLLLLLAFQQLTRESARKKRDAELKRLDEEIRKTIEAVAREHEYAKSLDTRTDRRLFRTNRTLLDLKDVIRRVRAIERKL